jgi:hypothetical protein
MYRSLHSSPDIAFEPAGFEMPRSEFNEIQEGPSNPGERLVLELAPYAHRVDSRSSRVISEPRWIGIHGADLPAPPAAGPERDPSPEEILEHCRMIREEWSEHVRRQRSCNRPQRTWSVPVIHELPSGLFD